MKNIPCCICGQKGGFIEVFKMKDFQFYCDRPGTPVRDIRNVMCPVCGFLFMDPQYDNKDIRDIFTRFSTASMVGQAHSTKDQYQWLIKTLKINKNKSPKKILDIGCSDAGFLSNFERNDFDLYGIDIDAYAIKNAHKQYPYINFSVGRIEDLDENAKFHIISISDVLEHLQSPRKALQKIRQILEDNGFLYIEVPITDKGIPNDIGGFFSVAHLSHFSPLSLKILLSLCGFKIIKHEIISSYNGYRVIAIKTGPSSKISTKPLLKKNLTRTKQFIDEHSRFQRSQIAKINKKIFDFVKKINGKIAVWGAGLHTETLYHLTPLFKIADVSFFVDSDTTKHGYKYHKIPIKSPKYLMKMKDKIGGIIISSYAKQKDILKMARSMGINKEKILLLYDNIVTK